VRALWQNLNIYAAIQFILDQEEYLFSNSTSGGWLTTRTGRTILTPGKSVLITLKDGQKSLFWLNHLWHFHQSSFDKIESVEHSREITSAELQVVGM